MTIVEKNGMVLIRIGGASYNAVAIAKMSKKAFTEALPNASKELHELCKKTVGLIDDVKEEKEAIEAE